MQKFRFWVKRLIWVVLLLLSLWACNNKERKTNAGYLAEGQAVPYAVNQPDTTFVMPKKLEEISGLGYNSDDSTLVCIDDEHGSFFFVDKNTGKIVEEVEFGDDNDYEGVEKVGDKVYILESDGDVHIYDLAKKKTLDKFENKLGEKNDLEGLGYDAERKILLLVCKKKGIDQKRKDIGRIIYQAKVGELEKISEYHTIDLSKNFEDLTAEGFTKGPFFNFIVMQRLRDFSPSGITVRPSTGEIYVVSSKGGVLVTLDPGDYKVNSILFLNRYTHIQPEGICFDADENLYISNEARGRAARIHMFRPTENIVLIEEGEKSALEVLLDADSVRRDSSEQGVDSLLSKEN